MLFIALVLPCLVAGSVLVRTSDVKKSIGYGLIAFAASGVLLLLSLLGVPGMSQIG